MKSLFLKNGKTLVVFWALLAFMFTGCGTWEDKQQNSDPQTSVEFSVIFEANGGVPSPSTQIVGNGSKVTEPTAMVKQGHAFEGWYKESSFTNLWDFSSDIVTGNMMLYAKWTMNPPSVFTVTFNSNGGVPQPLDQSVQSGLKATEPSSPSKIGYTFEGWYDNTLFSGNAWNFNANVISGDITLYAKWTINQYSVTFNANGGTPEPLVQSINYGGNVVEPSITKSGFTFEGWYKESSFTNLWDFSNDIVTGNMMLYAKWTMNPPSVFTVTFNSNGGVPQPLDQSVQSGSNAVQPAQPSKIGYTFNGWYEDVNFSGNAWNFNANVISGDITLYAKWTINQYSVTFNVNGGTPEPSVQSVQLGSKVTEPSQPSKAGYTFDGWYETMNFILWDFNNDIVTGNMTLYAKWTPNPPSMFTITFNSDGGTPEPSVQSINYGGNVIEPSITKSGFTFEGWYKESSFVNLWDFSGDIVTENVTLYAKWTQNPPSVFVVHFNSNSTWTNPAAQYINPGGKVIQPSVTKYGFIFEGWYAEDTFVNLWDFSNDVVTGDMTLYAKWKELDGVFDIANSAQFSNAADQIKYGGDNKNYLINFNGSQNSPASSGSYGNALNTFGDAQNITVTIKGSATLTLNAFTDAAMFVMGASQTLIIDDENLTLYRPQLWQGNSLPFILVRGGGSKLELRNGTITNNVFRADSYNPNGGAARVGGYGSFEMSGGVISGNNASNGGGVYIEPTASFTMSGGVIGGNIAYNRGGGVYIDNANFTKTGGVIYGYDDPNNQNIVSGHLDARGAAVYYNNGGDYYYVDATINGNISVYDTLPSLSGDTLNGWTKQ